MRGLPGHPAWGLGATVAGPPSSGDGPARSARRPLGQLPDLPSGEPDGPVRGEDLDQSSDALHGQPTTRARAAPSRPASRITWSKAR